ASTSERWLKLAVDLVRTLAGFVAGGRDVEPVLLGGGGEETPYAVRLPRCGLHYLRQRRSLRSPDQFQDLGSFALRPGLLVRRRPTASGVCAFCPAGIPGEGLAMANCFQYASHCRLLPSRLNTALQPRRRDWLHCSTCTTTAGSLSMPDRVSMNRIDRPPFVI